MVSPECNASPEYGSPERSALTSSAVTLPLLLFLAGFAAWTGTGLVRRYAVRRSLVDVPNPRSSHTSPTPRGGGLSIAVVVLGAITLQTAFGDLPRTLGVTFLAGGALIALTGWLDDRRNVPAGWRALAQFVAAGWVVARIGAPDSLWLGPWSLSLGPLAPWVAVVGLVWLINLFNFMDGIDGIAAGEAVSVALVGGALLLASGASGLGVTSLIAGFASAGFLAWNWPPARIFMGDVGSGFLGFLLGALAIAGAGEGAVPLLIWMLLLGVFLFDATATLLRRIPREKVYEAHRRHAYQRAVQAGWSHRRVTTSVLALNAFLAALAAAAWAVPSFAPLALIAAVGVLSLAYLAVERRLPMWAATA